MREQVHEGMARGAIGSEKNDCDRTRERTVTTIPTEGKEETKKRGTSSLRSGCAHTTKIDKKTWEKTLLTTSTLSGMGRATQDHDATQCWCVTHSPFVWHVPEARRAWLNHQCVLFSKSHVNSVVVYQTARAISTPTPIAGWDVPHSQLLSFDRQRG